jgi:hypothetical protein
MRTELPNGWAEIVDPTKLTEGKRRPLRIAIAKVQRSAMLAGFRASGDTKADEQAMLSLADPALVFEAGDVSIGALVSAWSYEGVPSAETALNLEGGDYDALLAALMTTAVKTEVDISDPTGDADSPFGSTNGSNPSSPASLPLATPVPNGVTIASSS